MGEHKSRLEGQPQKAAQKVMDEAVKLGWSGILRFVCVRCGRIFFRLEPFVLLYGIVLVTMNRTIRLNCLDCKNKVEPRFIILKAIPWGKKEID